ncbi:hypothetical protein AYO27_04660 [Rhizobium sp. GHKF11]|nr:hypothetical protein AYO27_04660 [Rhizobium sp. GHKF11]
MTTSSKIRALAAEGMETAEIARRLGVRYQHAYNVLKRRVVQTSVGEKPVIPSSPSTKPALPVSVLTSAGFRLIGRWALTASDELITDAPLPKDVGVATMGVAKRLYFYGKPGISQRTSQRLNGVIKGELRGSGSIEIYVAFPPDLEWNGLPVHGSAGLELGLIKKYALPWNMRSAG